MCVVEDHHLIMRAYGTGNDVAVIHSFDKKQKVCISIDKWETTTGFYTHFFSQWYFRFCLPWKYIFQSRWKRKGSEFKSCLSPCLRQEFEHSGRWFRRIQRRTHTTQFVISSKIFVWSQILRNRWLPFLSVSFWTQFTFANWNLFMYKRNSHC